MWQEWLARLFFVVWIVVLFYVIFTGAGMPVPKKKTGKRAE
jgi:hypothetical protein